MSEWRGPEVVELGGVEAHPNADALDITQVHGGYPCVIKRGEFHAGDRAVYIPRDSLVPADEDRWAFLGRGSSPKRIGDRSYWRIRPMRLRGTYSEGVLVHDDGSDPAAWGILHYEPPEPISLGGENERDPGFWPVYDLEALRRHPDALVPGEEVIITEKIHGCSARFCWRGDRLWVGSHTCTKRSPDTSGPEHPTTVWWRAANQYRLKEVLRDHAPDIVLYGEVYGSVQDLRYGTQRGEIRLALFDAFAIIPSPAPGWLNYRALRNLVSLLGIPLVPDLYEGPWDPSLVSLAEGATTLGGGHVREGIVIRPVIERSTLSLGRVVLKRHGEGYLIRSKT